MSGALAAALALAADGLPVFACGADKRPATARGFHDATRDPAALRAMFARPAAALIGVPTGAASGFVVVDGDVTDAADGRATLREWTASGRLPRTRTHETRRGGVHLLFRADASRPLRSGAGRLAPAVDTRGEGSGYIVWWPASGGRVLRDVPIAALPPVPAWLIEAAAPAPPAPPPAPAAIILPAFADGSRYALAALDAECRAILSAPPGRQETTLNAAALKVGQLVAGGQLQASAARCALLAAARHMANEPGRAAWAAAEIERKVDRGLADGATRPRLPPPSRSGSGWPARSPLHPRHARPRFHHAQPAREVPHV